MCRKQKNIYENLYKFAEESRRRAQLQNLECVNKSGLKKKMKKSKKKLPKNKKIKHFEAENEIIQEEVQEEAQEDMQDAEKSLSFVYDSDRNKYEPPSHMDLRVPDLSKIKSSIKENTSNSEYLSENNIPSNSNYDDYDEYHDNPDEEESHIYDSIKDEEDESFSSVDNQVSNIIHKWSLKDTDSKEIKQDEKDKKCILGPEKKINKPLIF